MWRNAVASIVLDQEVNAKWPHRDHESDGTIGDAAHASRQSDHNPWVKDRNGVGVVRARDIDEDLDGNKANGYFDARPLFDFLLAKAKAGDPRLNGGGYLIYERHIYSSTHGWTERSYSGINMHEHHVHVSFSLDAAGYDSNAPWGLLDDHHVFEAFHLGSKGEGAAFVADLGNILAKAGFAINSQGKPSHVQLNVPKDPAHRAIYVYDQYLRERVAEMQRFFVNMWALNGGKGPKPVVNGIADSDTLSRISFWVPVALQVK